MILFEDKTLQSSLNKKRLFTLEILKKKKEMERGCLSQKIIFLKDSGSLTKNLKGLK